MSVTLVFAPFLLLEENGQIMKAHQIIREFDFENRDLIRRERAKGT